MRNGDRRIAITLLATISLAACEDAGGGSTVETTAEAVRHPEIGAGEPMRRARNDRTEARTFCSVQDALEGDDVCRAWVLRFAEESESVLSDPRDDPDDEDAGPSFEREFAPIADPERAIRVRIEDAQGRPYRKTCELTLGNYCAYAHDGTHVFDGIGSGESTLTWSPQRLDHRGGSALVVPGRDAVVTVLPAAVARGAIELPAHQGPLVCQARVRTAGSARRPDEAPVEVFDDRDRRPRGASETRTFAIGHLDPAVAYDIDFTLVDSYTRRRVGWMDAAVTGVVPGGGACIVRFVEGGTIRGTLRAPDGSPLTRLTVRAIADDAPREASGVMDECVADAGGSFILDSVGPHTFQLTVEDSLRWWVSPTRARCGEQVVLHAVRKPALIGHLVDAEGSPVTWGEVVVWSGRNQLRDNLGTDGSFEISGLPAGEHSVVYVRGDSVEFELGRWQAPSQDARITVPAK